MEFVVTNEPPKGQRCEGLPGRLLEIFRAGAGSQSAKPFRHQAQAFGRILSNDELFLEAGTASGKTLAVGAPLFYKLEQGSSRKVLLMYPTLALLEDQRRVLQLLANATGLTEEVGQLRGGMSRSALIHNLNKRVLLATPDAVYWFFRKNVKYNALLVYGLCQVDEFVLDEAHLFNGLMLSNFEHLWQRIKALAKDLGKFPKLHILTATPSEELSRLNSEKGIPGRSKCRNVEVNFQPVGRCERAGTLAREVNEALAAGNRKVLVVCNSARMAHQLFEKYKVGDATKIPLEHRLKFGRMKLSDLTECLMISGAEEEIVEALTETFSRQESVSLADVPGGAELPLPLQDVVAHTTEVLESQCWLVKRALGELAQYPGDTLEMLLGNRPLPCNIVSAIRQSLKDAADVEDRRSVVDEWLTITVDRIADLNKDPVRCRAGGFDELTWAFVTAGLEERLASLLTKRLTFKMQLPPEQVPGHLPRDFPVSLRWLDWVLEGDQAEKARGAIAQALESGELGVKFKHIGVWRGADVPIVVYSGSMSRSAREGLIGVFSDLQRAVLISTSAVEVGVDFDADVLVTEECEGRSFLQRFGRVGRHSDGSRVVVLVSGDVYANLNELDGAKISREEFSEKIVGAFPKHTHAADSQLLNAGHYLVNEQLGRIGEKLNTESSLQDAASLAGKLRAADIRLNFGLRGTLPQITLRDGIGKDPFYLLRYVDDGKLRPADSPFEVAQAREWFTNLIFRKADFDVIVDLSRTLKASQHLFLPNDDIESRPGVGAVYLSKMIDYFDQVGGWSKQYPGNLMLLNGDVYLTRVDRDLKSLEPVLDTEQSPLFIPNQTYMVLYEWTNEEETRRLLECAGVVGWQELHYDWDRLQFSGAKAMVILENAAGACFAAYKELWKYFSKQIQR